jgi:hypothetical protein
MNKDTIEVAKLFLNTLQTLAIIVTAIWTYLRFFKEGTHRARIEMDISCDILRPSNDFRALGFRITATNRGHVDFRFRDLRIRVRGALRGKELKTKDVETLTGPTPYLEFTEGDRHSHSVIPKRSKYFFVRPGVTQHFSYITMVPVSWSMVSARASFKYPTKLLAKLLGVMGWPAKSGELHTAERVFPLGDAEQRFPPDAETALRR